MLLKPWWDLNSDLKLPTQSWKDAYDQYVSCAPEWVRFITSGIQYFHDCNTAAKKWCEEEDQFEEVIDQRVQIFNGDDKLDEMELGEGVEEDRKSVV